MRRPVYFLACFALALAAAAYSQTPPSSCSIQPPRGKEPNPAPPAPINTAVKAGPEALRAFLEGFPKGADLHVHLSGAVYAETFIRDAGEDGLCVDPVALSFAKPPCTGKLIPATQLSGNISAANQALYDKLIDSFSMRSFVPSAGWSGHDQFFATFDRFGGLSKTHTAEWVDEVASRAAAQNEQYLELMETPPFSHAAQIAHQIGWSPALAQADQQAFAQFRQQLLDQGLRDEVAADRDEVRQAEAGRKQAGTLRNAAGRARLPGGGPLPLPGAARQPAGAGVCADAAGV